MIEFERSSASVVQRLKVLKKQPAVGFEPTTPSLRSLCNNHYATRAKVAGGEIRTRDPLLTRQMQ